MKTLIAIILSTLTLNASNFYLVLTPNQFNVANNWLNQQNGWPDGNGTERYAEPMVFSQFSNAATGFTNRNNVVVDLTGKVGLVLDKALIRNVADAIPGDTRQAKAERVFDIVRNNLSNPTVVRVVDTGDEVTRTAEFTDVTAEVKQRIRDLVK